MSEFQLLKRYGSGLRDYLRAMGGRTREQQAFRQIVGVYEPICFGRRPAQIDHYRTSLDGYQSGFREPPAADSASAGKGTV